MLLGFRKILLCSFVPLPRVNKVTQLFFLKESEQYPFDIHQNPMFIKCSQELRLNLFNLDENRFCEPAACKSGTMEDLPEQGKIFLKPP